MTYVMAHSSSTVVKALEMFRALHCHPLTVEHGVGLVSGHSTLLEKERMHFFQQFQYGEIVSPFAFPVVIVFQLVD
jgi:hypothetical protein